MEDRGSHYESAYHVHKAIAKRHSNYGYHTRVMIHWITKISLEQEVSSRVDMITFVTSQWIAVFSSGYHAMKRKQKKNGVHISEEKSHKTKILLFNRVDHRLFKRLNNSCSIKWTSKQCEKRKEVLFNRLNNNYLIDWTSRIQLNEQQNNTKIKDVVLNRLNNKMKKRKNVLLNRLNNKTTKRKKVLFNILKNKTTKRKKVLLNRLNNKIMKRKEVLFNRLNNKAT